MKIGLPVPTSLLVQAESSYDRYMQLGYNATRQRNYPDALTYFKQALQGKPGDTYATIAVRNITSYIARDRQTARKRRRYLIYIPAYFGQPRRLVPAGSRGAKKPQETETALRVEGNEQNGAAVNGSTATQENVQDQTARRGRFGRRSSPGTRVSQACTQDNPPITPLVPLMNEHQITTAAYPTLFFYIPQAYAQAPELVVSDENNQTIYRGTFNISGQPGIVSLTLPVNSTVPELRIGKTYRWYLSVVCDRTNRSQDLVLQGSIQRIEPDQQLKLELKKADERERAAVYAMSGFLPDSLTTLAQLRREHPNDADLKTDWEDLLQSAGLEEIAQSPLVQCCKLVTRF